MENLEPLAPQPPPIAYEPPLEQMAEPPGSKSTKKGLVTGPNMVLGGLLLAAMIGIYLLHLKSVPTPASAAQQESEQKVDTFLTDYKGRQTVKTSSKTAEVVNTIYFDNTKRQVPASQLASNPFQFKSAQEPTKAAGPAKAVMTDIDLDIAMQKAKALKLQSVMSSSRGGGKAVINDTALTVGKKISGWKVVKIEPMAVTLKFRNTTYVLRLE